VLAGVFFLYWSIQAGHWVRLSYEPAWLDVLTGEIPWAKDALIGGLLALALGAHFGIRKLAAMSVAAWLRKQVSRKNLPGDLMTAFRQNTRFYRPVILGTPAGWNRKTRAEINEVLQSCENYVQTLNERYTNPKGLKEPPPKAQTERLPDDPNAVLGKKEHAAA
jgi:hypothetical protein